MSVSIVTDSAASLPDDLVRASNVNVVPMHLSVGNNSYKEGDIAVQEMIGDLEKSFSTSGPSPGEFLQAIEAANQGDGVIVLTVSSGMSGTYQAARIAVETYGGTARVVDTGTAAGGQALVVLAAAKAAAAGRSIDDVEAEALAASGDIRLVATLPTLAYLAKSGRVPGVAAWAGTRLGLCPLFEFTKARVRPLMPARGSEAALEKMLAACKRSAAKDASLQVVAMHAAEPETAEMLIKKVTEDVPAEMAFIAAFGAVMVAHTGPGLVGLAWRWIKQDGNETRSSHDGDASIF